jgi:hypothetical protein
MRRLYEWKDAQGNTINLNNKTSSTTSNTNNTTTRNFPDQTERYKKLLAQIDKEKRFTYEVITLTDNALVFHLNIDSSKFITIAIVYKPYTNPPVWRLGIDGNKTVDYETWNDVLDVLEVIIKDISSLKESFKSSMAEDFELYENLWNNTLI